MKVANWLCFTCEVQKGENALKLFRKIFAENALSWIPRIGVQGLTVLYPIWCYSDPRYISKLDAGRGYSTLHDDDPQKRNLSHRL